MKHACLILRGAHYSLHNLHQHYTNTHYTIQVDFLKRHGYTVDTILITYESSIQDKLLTDFQPVETFFLKQSEYYDMTGWKRQCFYHMKSRELIEKAEATKNIQYDIIINTRFDIAFVKGLEHFGTFDFTKINCCLQHECGNCDDNFFLFPRNLLNTFVDGFTILYNENRITHEFSKVVDKKLMNYLFEEKDFRTTITDEHGQTVEKYNYFYLTRKHV